MPKRSLELYRVLLVWQESGGRVLRNKELLQARESSVSKVLWGRQGVNKRWGIGGVLAIKIARG